MMRSSEGFSHNFNCAHYHFLGHRNVFCILSISSCSAALESIIVGGTISGFYSM
ncbi:hypothetical protein P692DRAFT_20835618 [Suillus brevipes Sb2]|nr:hypothetical protein P692DRAFT_20835618 [Suillus brevipes Sb2]